MTALADTVLTPEAVKIHRQDVRDATPTVVDLAYLLEAAGRCNWGPKSHKLLGPRASYAPSATYLRQARVLLYDYMYAEGVLNALRTMTEPQDGA